MDRNDQRPPTNMACLACCSNEILWLIVADFCPHCRGQQISRTPDADFWDWHQPDDKRRRDGYMDQPYYHQRRPWLSPSDRLALYTLCLVSRRCRDIAQPILYHGFGMGRNRHFQIGQVPSLIRTVSRRPDLASKLKWIVIDTMEQRPFAAVSDVRAALEIGSHALGIDILQAWRQRTAARSAADCQLRNEFMVSFLGGNGEPRCSEFMDSQSQRQCLAVQLIALLVAHLPNLQHLCLNSIFAGAYPESFHEADFLLLGVSKLPLQTLDAWTPMGGLHFAPLAIELETLNLYNCIHLMIPVPLLPKLKTLRLTWSALSKERLGYLLSRCTGCLSTFVYESCDLRPSHDKLASPADVVESLGMHRKTLESLWLDFRTAADHSHDEAHVGPMLRLAKFAALERVCINDVNIRSTVKGLPVYGLLNELLPPKIVDACLTGNVSSTLGQLAIHPTTSNVNSQQQQGHLSKLDLILCSAKFDISHELVSMTRALANFGVRAGYRTWFPSRARPIVSDLDRESPPPMQRRLLDEEQEISTDV